MASDFYRERLDRPYRKLYDQVLEWFRTDLTADSDTRTFRVKGVSAEGEDVRDTIWAVINDHPEIVCLGHTKGWYGFDIPPVTLDEDGSLTISMHDVHSDFSYAYTAEERVSIAAGVEKWKNDVLARVKGGTDAERIVSLTGIFASDFTYLENAPSHDISGVITGRLVCEGIARAFKVICDALGIWCIIAWGKAGNSQMPAAEWGNHCWNIVRIGDGYYHIDPTWANSDSPTDPMGVLGGGRKVFSYGFLFMSDADLEGNHRPLIDSYPKCADGDMEYYRAHGWVMRFDRGFVRCLTDRGAMKGMVRKVHGLHGDVFVLRCRITDEDGKLLAPASAMDTVSRITEYTVPTVLGIKGYGIHRQSYSPASGNYMLVFKVRKEAEGGSRRERIDAV